MQAGAAKAAPAAMGKKETYTSVAIEDHSRVAIKDQAKKQQGETQNTPNTNPNYTKHQKELVDLCILY